MAGKDDKEELESLLLNVAIKRKQYPETCAKLLSNTLKIEINLLKSAIVEFNSSTSNIDESVCTSEKHKEEIRKVLQLTNSSESQSNVDNVLKEAQNIVSVLDQMKKEKTCETDIYMYNFNNNLKKVK